MSKCSDCGEKVGWLVDRCDACLKHRIDKAHGENREIQEQEKIAKIAPEVILSTAPCLEGYRIVKTVEVITAECVFGMNIFKDIFASFTDIFGGRSESSQRILRDARKTCLDELRREAHTYGANAVIAIDLDYSEFSGGGKSMLFLVASGTAVIVEPLTTQTP